MPSRVWHFGPDGTVRKLMLREGLAAHLRGEARRRRRKISAAADPDRVEEMVVEMVHELDGPILHRAADGDVIGHGEVLHELAEADTSSVRKNPDAELRGHQQDGEILVDTAHASGIDLHQVHGLCLEELLESDAVVRVLSCGDRDRSDRVSDRGVAEDVIGIRRLLGPGDAEIRKCPQPGDRSRHVPTLVGIDRKPDVGPNWPARDTATTDVLRDVATDLYL